MKEPMLVRKGKRDRFIWGRCDGQAQEYVSLVDIVHEAFRVSDILDSCEDPMLACEQSVEGV